MPGTTRIADLPKCTICQSPLRPYNSRKGDWPGTKGKVSTNPLRCTAHQYGRKTGRYDFREDREVERVDMNQVRLVRRRIQERFEGDDYLLITEALGIGDDIE